MIRSLAPRASVVRRISLAVALGIGALGALPGCGYTSQSLVSQEYRTVAVPIFENHTRRHDLEFELTRAVVEEIQGRTHLRVVNESDAPDLVLRGALDKVEEDVLSKRRYQRIRESVVFLTAEITYETPGGQTVISKRSVTERESFVPDKGETIRSSREAAIRRLAEKIVRELEQGW